MGNKITKLFVYGSLRSGFQSPAYEYISKFFNLVSEAKAKGKLYDLGSYPAAVPTTDDSFIIGELYELKKPSDFSWAIEQLDAYEGVVPDDGEAQLYKRELAEVFYGNETITAWVYWYNGEIADNPLIASGNIFDFIHQKSKL